MTSTPKSKSRSFSLVIMICAAFIIAVIFLLLTVFTLKPNYSGIVIRMGKIQRIESNDGPHMHVPFIEHVVKVYTGDTIYDIPTSDVITSDKKSMIADDYVIWVVTDPKKYYQTLGAVQGRAEERLEAAVYNATKNTISSMKQEEIIAARGSTLTDLITKASNSDIAQYGIEIKIAEIKALDLPDDNKQAVYDRMISERNKIAASFTAQGDAEKQKIYNETDKQVSITVATAEAEAAKIEAEGESQYMQILADAYNDPDKADFYTFIRGLDSLKALAGENKTLILDKNSEYAQLLYGLR